MKKKKREKVRQQQRPSITGNNHITAEDRNLFALPLGMGEFDITSNTVFSRNCEW